MFLSKELAERRPQPLLGAAAHGIEVLLQQLDLETGHQPLRQLPDVPAAVRQALPFVRLEESELGGHVGRSIGATEMQVRDRRCPRVDIGRQQPRPAHEPVDKAALASFHLPNNGNATCQPGKQAKRVVDEGAAPEGWRGLQLAPARDKLSS